MFNEGNSINVFRNIQLFVSFDSRFAKASAMYLNTLYKFKSLRLYFVLKFDSDILSRHIVYFKEYICHERD